MNEEIMYLLAKSYQKEHNCDCPYHEDVELIGINEVTEYLESLERKENLGKLYRITIVEVEKHE